MSADSLAAQIDEWRDALNSLAHDFHSGNASVSPKHYPQTCEYCEQRLLCRLDLSALDADALEDPDDAEADAFSAAGEEEDLA
jgi:ATP-dependent helicase/nuclease subunit B